MFFACKSPKLNFWKCQYSIFITKCIIKTFIEERDPTPLTCNILSYDTLGLQLHYYEIFENWHRRKNKGLRYEKIQIVLIYFLYKTRRYSHFEAGVSLDPTKRVQPRAAYFGVYYIIFGYIYNHLSIWLFIQHVDLLVSWDDFKLLKSSGFPPENSRFWAFSLNISVGDVVCMYFSQP